jgi:hypothetical protein
MGGEPTMLRARHACGRLATLSLLAGLCLVAGCRSPGRADPKTARDTLRDTFEAWKQGNTPDGYLRESSVRAIDSRWEGGFKLLGYEIAEGEEAQGFDLTFKVALKLQDPKGRALQETAPYRVATSPKKVVIRSEDF